MVNVGYPRLPHMTNNHCAHRLSPWGTHGWLLPWIWETPFTVTNWLSGKLAFVRMGREEGEGDNSNLFNGPLLNFVSGSVGRCQSTSSHGTRCHLTLLQTNILLYWPAIYDFQMDVPMPLLRWVDNTAVDGWTAQLLYACRTPCVQFSLVVWPARLQWKMLLSIA